MIIFYIVILLLIILDQAIKIYVHSNMYLGESIAVIHNIFHITYVMNKGAAFGILHGYTNVLLTLAVLLVVVVLYFYRTVKSCCKLVQLSVALLLGGAIGNLVDRLRFGGVVDFLDFRIWPVFNLADMGIVCGSAILLYFVLSKKSDGGIFG